MLDQYPDDQVVVLDKLTYAGNLDNLADCRGRPALPLRPGRHRRRRASSSALVAEVDAVVNFAAETHVDRSILDAGALHRDRRARHLGAAGGGARRPESQRFLQVSTDEVYGEVPVGSLARDRPARAAQPLRGQQGRRRADGAAPTT